MNRVTSALTGSANSRSLEQVTLSATMRGAAEDSGRTAAIVSRNDEGALAIGERLDLGLLHINDAPVNNEGVNPLGEFGASGNGTSIGRPANREEFPQWQGVTVKAAAPAYPL